MTQPRAVDIKSRTEKTYTVTLDGCEPRQWPYSRTDRRYTPRRLIVVKRDGNVYSIELIGPILKKDGTDGGQDARERFYSFSSTERPAWLDSIVGGLA